MKRISALLCLLLCAMGGVWAQNGKPFVIPELKEWKGGRGFLFLIRRYVSFMMTLFCRRLLRLLPQITKPCSALCLKWFVEKLKQAISF